MSERIWSGYLVRPWARLVGYRLAAAVMTTMLIMPITTAQAEYVTLWAAAEGGGITTLGEGDGGDEEGLSPGDCDPDCEYWDEYLGDCLPLPAGTLLDDCQMCDGEGGVSDDPAPDGGACGEGGGCCEGNCIHPPDEPCTPPDPPGMQDEDLGQLRDLSEVAQFWPPWSQQKTVMETREGEVTGTREKEYQNVGQADPGCGSALVRSDDVPAVNLPISFSISAGPFSLGLFQHTASFGGETVQVYNESAEPCIAHRGIKWEIRARDVITASGYIRQYVQEWDENGVPSGWELNTEHEITGEDRAGWEVDDLTGTTCSDECAPE